MSIAKMTSKGQITVPREVREQLRLVAGTRVRFVRNEAGDFVVTREPRSVKNLRGLLAYTGAAKSLEDMQAGIEHGASRVDDE